MKKFYYERSNLLESEVKLDGKLNAVGYIYFDKTNIYNYKFDNTLKDIIKKYRCTIYNPYYDKSNDLINFKIKIKIICIIKKFFTCFFTNFYFVIKF